jgi:hypothetical protein
MNIFVIFTIGIILFLIVFFYINYKVIFVSKYKIENEKIPQSFDGYKILHLSDWHCTYYGKNNVRLKKLINKQDVDAIFISGDFIVRQKKETKPVLEFISQINSKKIYYVMGNHELALNWKKLCAFCGELEKLGVTVIENKKVLLKKNDDRLVLYGLRYNSNNNDNRVNMTEEVVQRYKKKYISELGNVNSEYFNILLTHDPLYFEVYAKMGFDLIYAGHLHGGGIRLFGFGLATPRKKWTFTRLAAGLKKKYNSNMIVSRGVGNSTIPVRIFNPPEISITTLYSKRENK